ncbi:hypothetical protein KCU95_g2329, partial [Aureobasidium melanogenum]
MDDVPGLTIIEDEAALLLDTVEEAEMLLAAIDDVLELLMCEEIANAEEDEILLIGLILDVVILVAVVAVVTVGAIVRLVTVVGVVAVVGDVAVLRVVAVVRVVTAVGFVAVVGVAEVAVAKIGFSEGESLKPTLLDAERLVVVILKLDEVWRLEELKAVAEDSISGEEMEDETYKLFEDGKEELELGEELLGEDVAMLEELDVVAEARPAEEDATEDIDDDTLELLEEDALDEEELAEDDKELLTLEEELLENEDDIEAVTEASFAENDKSEDIDDETLELLEDDALELEEDDRLELTELEEEELLDDVAEARLAETP